MARHPMLQQAISLSVAGRNPEAILIINQLAAQGEAEALFVLAEMKWRGGMVPQDPVAARDLYRRASAAGHAGAHQLFTNLLGSGIAGERNWGEAMARLREEARGDARRRTILGLLREMKLDAEGDPRTLPKPRELSASPEARLFPRLISRPECSYLLRLAESGYAPSMVFNAERRLVRDQIRTSDGSTIHWLIEDPLVHALNRRIARATSTSPDRGEALQILRYRPGEQYRTHFDYVGTGDNQRPLTALIYLNEDYRGGETVFPRTGLKVKGKTGDVLVFRNAGEDGRPDPMSQHAGLPVEAGIKYLATRWIRARRWPP